MSAAALFVDSRQVRRNFARAAAGYESAAVLQREIGSRMLERLDYVKIDPQRILDLGCGTGSSLAALGERYRQAEIIGADLSPAMLEAGRGQRSRLRWLLPFLRANKTKLLAADAAALPLLSGSQGLVWSNLLLHWLDDPLPAFREMHRVLDLGGLSAVHMGYGEPGTGKSMLISALATMLSDYCKNLGVPFLFWPMPNTVVSTFQGGSAERMMGWKAQYDIADMCRDSWNWQSHNPNGFADAE